jgi:hypothetical protein
VIKKWKKCYKLKAKRAVFNNNNNNDKTCLLIDVAIPSDKNVIQKEAENKL